MPSSRAGRSNQSSGCHASSWANATGWHAKGTVIAAILTSMRNPIRLSSAMIRQRVELRLALAALRIVMLALISTNDPAETHAR
jgi:hypothetical protein